MTQRETEEEEKEGLLTLEGLHVTSADVWWHLHIGPMTLNSQVWALLTLRPRSSPFRDLSFSFAF